MFKWNFTIYNLHKVILPLAEHSSYLVSSPPFFSFQTTHLIFFLSSNNQDYAFPFIGTWIHGPTYSNRLLSNEVSGARKWCWIFEQENVVRSPSLRFSLSQKLVMKVVYNNLKMHWKIMMRSHNRISNQAKCKALRRLERRKHDVHELNMKTYPMKNLLNKVLRDTFPSLE